MATVTGLTAERMLEIEAASVVDGDVIGGDLILTRHDASQINAGNVIGPEGPQGPVGSDWEVLAAQSVLDIGLVNQIRAGRQLGPEDFGNFGLSAPLGLWNLSNLADSSGNGRNLLNKGAVPFSMGINGVATTAALFSGSTAQALYIADTGAADPFRIKEGSLGAWIRTAKRNFGGYQVIMSKRSAGATALGYQFSVISNFVVFHLSINGTSWETVCQGDIDVCDDHWHFVVVTHDGNACKLYVDGVLDATQLHSSALINGPAQPFNIGALSADGGAAAIDPFFGRVDEAFITSDILTLETVRNLYCAKIPHSLGAVPDRLLINIRRRRKGPAFADADFPFEPIRLHNFSAGSLSDEGSGGVALTNTGPAVSVQGVDGIPGNAFNLGGTHYLSSTDTGLPSGTSTVSFGCWFKTTMTGVTAGYLMIWGTTPGVNDQRLYVANGLINFGSGSDAVAGPNIADGKWHFAVVVLNNSATDGVKRKLYIDGKLVAISLIMNSTTLGGANKFIIGASPTPDQYLFGQVDGVFVINTELTLENIIKLYTKGTQALAPSPKNPENHVEAMDDGKILAIFDSLNGVDQVDMKVAE